MAYCPILVGQGKIVGGQNKSLTYRDYRDYAERKHVSFGGSGTDLPAKKLVENGN